MTKGLRDVCQAIEDVEIRKSFRLHLLRIIELIELELSFYLGRLPFDVPGVLSLRNIDYFTKYPFSDFVKEYRDLSDYFENIDADTYEDLGRRQSFLKDLQNFRNKFQYQATKKEFPYLFVWISVFLTQLALGYKKSKDYSSGALLLFRALDFYCMGILVDNKRGYFDGNWEFSIGNSKVFGFSQVWQEVVRSSRVLEQKTVNDVDAICSLRNKSIMTHKTLQYNKSIFNHFYASVKNFISEFDNSYGPTSPLSWEKYYHENNVNLYKKVAFNTSNSLLKKLGYAY